MITKEHLSAELASLDEQRTSALDRLKHIAGAEQMVRHLIGRMEDEEARAVFEAERKKSEEAAVETAAEPPADIAATE